VTNVIFGFETSPNTNPKRKKWGGMAYYVPGLKKWGGHVPRVPHQIAPMQLVNMASCLTKAQIMLFLCCVSCVNNQLNNKMFFCALLS